MLKPYNLLTIIAILFVGVISLIYLNYSRPNVEVWHTFSEPRYNLTLNYPSNLVTISTLELDYKIDKTIDNTTNINGIIFYTDTINSAEDYLSFHNYFIYDKKTIDLIIDIKQQSPDLAKTHLLVKKVFDTIQIDLTLPTSTNQSAPSEIVEKQLGIIKKAYLDTGKQYIDIDYVNWVDDSSAPNNFRIENINSLVRKFEVSSTAKIYVLDWNDEGLISPSISFEELTRVISGTSANYNYQSPLFDIIINNNQISEIKMRYTP